MGFIERDEARVEISVVCEQKQKVTSNIRPHVKKLTDVQSFIVSNFREENLSDGQGSPTM